MAPPLLVEQLRPDGPYVANAGEFEYPEVRRRFVSRVFAILSLQMGFTVWLVAVCVFVEDARKAVRLSIALASVAWIVFVVAFLTIHFGGKHVRRGPLGVICLLLLTASVTYIAVITSVLYSTQSVLYAACITGIICLTISLFTGCLKLDFIKCSGIFIAILSTATLGVLLYFILFFLLPDTRWVEVLGATCGSTLFITLLLLEMQAIVGGRVISVHPDEVTYAASQLYSQIAFIYYFLLMCKF